MAAKISLQDAPVFRAIENGAPRFQLTHAIGRFLRVQLGHAPLVHVLAAAHRVREMHFPVVAIIDIGKRGRDAALSHDGMRFAKKRFTDKPDGNASRRRLNRSAQTGAARPDYENVVLDSFIFRHA